MCTVPNKRRTAAAQDAEPGKSAKLQRCTELGRGAKLQRCTELGRGAKLQRCTELGRGAKSQRCTELGRGAKLQRYALVTVFFLPGKETDKENARSDFKRKPRTRMKEFGQSARTGSNKMAFSARRCPFHAPVWKIDKYDVIRDAIRRAIYSTCGLWSGGGGRVETPRSDFKRKPRTWMKEFGQSARTGSNKMAFSARRCPFHAPVWKIDKYDVIRDAIRRAIYSTCGLRSGGG
ncbi:hypothetical protein Btru_077298 [Bulinus truncatus]|nr:hypothetical protein Btru_077298 [Bulinus truncatus]